MRRGLRCRRLLRVERHDVAEYGAYRLPDFLLSTCIGCHRDHCTDKETGPGILVLSAVAGAYTILRPGIRTALAYHEKLGGTWSEDWLAGVTSYLAVTRHFSTVVFVAALLLAAIAIRSRSS